LARIDTKGPTLPASSESDSSYLKLEDVLAVLRRRKLLIGLTVVLAVVLAVVGTALRPARYRATAEVLVTRSTARSLFDSTPEPLTAPGQLAQGEVKILRSEPVKDLVRSRYGSSPAITVVVVSATNVLQLSAERRSASDAVKIANAYADAYLDFRRQKDQGDLRDASQQLQAKISDLQQQIDQAPPAQKDSLTQAQSYFRQQFDQLQVDAARTAAGAQLLNRAAVPSQPIGPSPAKAGLWALGLGLVLGVGLAVVRETLDDVVETKGSLERLLHVPVVGVLPARRSRQPDTTVVSLVDPHSADAEAYRTLRTAMVFIALQRPLRTLQVTSPGPAEGKTTIVANLGVALARAGQRVVIVGCDLRRPRVHALFGLTAKVGLTSVLLGEQTLDEAIQPVPDQSRLSVLASGPLPPNPSELLMLSRTANLLQALQERADILLLDSPPLLPVTDAVVLSRHADAVLVACAAGKTRRKHVVRAMELLSHVNAAATGLVLFGTDAEEAYSYYSTGSPGKARPGGSDDTNGWQFG
jgi:capsular exopolysaccharide synthesis family protein